MILWRWWVRGLGEVSVEDLVRWDGGMGLDWNDGANCYRGPKFLSIV